MVFAGDTGVDGSCLHPINPVVTATAAKILIKIFFTFFLLWVPWNVELHFPSDHQMGFQFYWANSDFLVDCWVAELLVFQIFFPLIPPRDFLETEEGENMFQPQVPF